MTEFAAESQQAIPLWREPVTNAQALLCHFIPFEAAIKLGKALIENELKSKQRDYAKLAELLYPIYSSFAVYINPHRVHFYNAASKLWGKDETMEPSVMFLIRLLRHFLDGPFRCHQEGAMQNAEPDEMPDQKECDAMMKAITKLVIDLGNNGPQSSLIKQLRLCAAAQIYGKEDEIALSFGHQREWLPFRNGIDVNVYSLETRIRTREHRQVYCCQIDWNDRPDPGMVESIRNFFMTIASGKEDRMLDLLVQAFTIFSGDNHKFMFINLGQTANSKSTLMLLYEAILGDFAIRAAKSTFLQSKGQASSHTGFLSHLAFKRLIVLDDQFSNGDNLNLPLLKRVTTPGNEELVRDPYTKETFKIVVGGTIVFCLNPDDIPKSLCIASDPALERRVILILHETRFVSADVFANLPPEHQNSGFYAIADDALIGRMNTPPLLQALAYFVLAHGGQEFERRCQNGQAFTPDPELLRRYFGKESDDFPEWWKSTATSADKKLVSVRTIAERYNNDHPGKPELTAEKALSLVRKLHPTPTIAPRRVKKEELMCVSDFTFKRVRILPSASPFSSSSSSAGPSTIISHGLVDDNDVWVDELNEKFDEISFH